MENKTEIMQRFKNAVNFPIYIYIYIYMRQGSSGAFRCAVAHTNAGL